MCSKVYTLDTIECILCYIVFDTIKEAFFLKNKATKKEHNMIIYEFPALLIVFLFCGLLGMDLAPILSFVAVIGIIFSIFTIITEIADKDSPIMGIIGIVINILILILFAGKSFRLFDIFTWLFS